MKTVLPLTISGDTNAAEALLRNTEDCGPVAFWQWLRSHAAVVLPEPAEVAVKMVVSDSPPGPDSEAQVWFDTTFSFIAVRSDQGWVINNSRQGMLQPIVPDTVDDHVRLNEYLVELTSAEKTELGVTGRWGRYQLPKRTGVIYR
jgi:hypothetical protein